MVRILLTLMLVPVFISLSAQEEIPVWKKLRYLSEEEMYLELRHARDFVETDPPEGEIRNIAEFDQMQKASRPAPPKPPEPAPRFEPEPDFVPEPVRRFEPEPDFEPEPEHGSC